MAKFIYVVLALTVLVAVSIAVPLEDDDEAELNLMDLLVKRQVEDFEDEEAFTAEKRGKKIDCKFQ